MVQDSFTDPQTPASGQPYPPGKIQLVRVHKKVFIESAQTFKLTAEHQIRTAFGHENFPCLGKIEPLCRESEEIESARAQALKVVGIIIQHARRGGCGGAFFRFTDQDFQSVRFQTCVIIEEEKPLATRFFSGQIIALAVAVVAAVLDEASMARRPDGKYLFAEMIGAVSGLIVGNDRFGLIKNTLCPH